MYNNKESISYEKKNMPKVSLADLTPPSSDYDDISLSSLRDSNYHYHHKTYDRQRNTRRREKDFKPYDLDKTQVKIDDRPQYILIKNSDDAQSRSISRPIPKFEYQSIQNSREHLVPTPGYHTTTLTGDTFAQAIDPIVDRNTKFWIGNNQTKFRNDAHDYVNDTRVIEKPMRPSLLTKPKNNYEPIHAKKTRGPKAVVKKDQPKQQLKIIPEFFFKKANVEVKDNNNNNNLTKVTLPLFNQPSESNNFIFLSLYLNLLIPIILGIGITYMPGLFLAENIKIQKLQSTENSNKLKSLFFASFGLIPLPLGLLFNSFVLEKLTSKLRSRLSFSLFCSTIGFLLVVLSEINFENFKRKFQLQRTFLYSGILFSSFCFGIYLINLRKMMKQIIIPIEVLTNPAIKKYKNLVTHYLLLEVGITFGCSLNFYHVIYWQSPSSTLFNRLILPISCVILLFIGFIISSFYLKDPPLEILKRRYEISNGKQTSNFGSYKIHSNNLTFSNYKVIQSCNFYFNFTGENSGNIFREMYIQALTHSLLFTEDAQKNVKFKYKYRSLSQIRLQNSIKLNEKKNSSFKYPENNGYLPKNMTISQLLKFSPTSTRSLFLMTNFIIIGNLLSPTTFYILISIAYKNIYKQSIKIFGFTVMSQKILLFLPFVAPLLTQSLSFVCLLLSFSANKHNQSKRIFIWNLLSIISTVFLICSLAILAISYSEVLNHQKPELFIPLNYFGVLGFLASYQLTWNNISQTIYNNDIRKILIWWFYDKMLLYRTYLYWTSKILFCFLANWFLCQNRSLEKNLEYVNNIKVMIDETYFKEEQRKLQEINENLKKRILEDENRQNQILMMGGLPHIPNSTEKFGNLDQKMKEMVAVFSRDSDDFNDYLSNAKMIVLLFCCLFYIFGLYLMIFCSKNYGSRKKIKTKFTY